jgi:hypothetical protein
MGELAAEIVAAANRPLHDRDALLALKHGVSGVRRPTPSASCAGNRRQIGHPRRRRTQLGHPDCDRPSAGAATAVAITALTALVLASPTRADTTLHDAAGHVTGFARTDANNVTHFYDRARRPTGSARTDSNGVTRFYDAVGHVTGTMTGKQ